MVSSLLTNNRSSTRRSNSTGTQPNTKDDIKTPKHKTFNTHWTPQSHLTSKLSPHMLEIQITRNTKVERKREELAHTIRGSNNSRVMSVHPHQNGELVSSLLRNNQTNTRRDNTKRITVRSSQAHSQTQNRNPKIPKYKTLNTYWVLQAHLTSMLSDLYIDPI